MPMTDGLTVRAFWCGVLHAIGAFDLSALTDAEKADIAGRRTWFWTRRQHSRLSRSSRRRFHEVPGFHPENETGFGRDGDIVVSLLGQTGVDQAGGNFLSPGTISNKN